MKIRQNHTLKRPLGFILLRHGARFGVLIVLFSIAALISFITFQGAPTLGPALLFGNTPPLDALFGARPVWDGLWPALAGTLCLVTLATFLSLFPGIGCGIFLAVYAGPRWKKIIGSAVDVLSGTPSIVMGMFGFTLILFLHRTFFPHANTCLLLAAGCLALLVLPVLIVSTREALDAVPDTFRLTAAALGLGKTQCMRHILLPAASRGIWSGIVLAAGRSAEDTAVIMLTGVVANAGLPAGLTSRFEALPFSVYYTAAQYQSPEELRMGFGAAFLLLLFAGGMVLLARTIEAGYRRHWIRGNS